MKQDLTPFNDKGQAHGYWERYWGNGNLGFKGNYVNGEQSGYCELYWRNGDLDCKKYYIL